MLELLKVEYLKRVPRLPRLSHLLTLICLMTSFVNTCSNIDDDGTQGNILAVADICKKVLKTDDLLKKERKFLDNSSMPHFMESFATKILIMKQQIPMIGKFRV